MYFRLALLIIIGQAYASTSYQTNQYMDTVLQKNLINVGKSFNIDPAKLLPFNNDYKITKFFVKINVKMSYYNIKMMGLFKGERAGDCSPIYRDIFDNVTLNCTLKFDDIKFKFEGKMKFGKLPSMRFSVETYLSPTFAAVEVTSRFNSNLPSMRMLQLIKIGEVSVRFSGMGPFNNRLKRMAEVDLIKRTSIEFLNIFVFNYSKAMEIAITQTPMPVFL